MSLLPAPISAATCFRARSTASFAFIRSMVLAGRVPERLGEERQHRLEHTRIHRGWLRDDRDRSFASPVYPAKAGHHRSRATCACPPSGAITFLRQWRNDTIRVTVCVVAKAARARYPRLSATLTVFSASRMRFLIFHSGVADAALCELIASCDRPQARRHGDRTIHGLDHIRHRDRRGVARQPIPPARALDRHQQPQRTRRCSTFASSSSGMSYDSEISRALDEPPPSGRIARCLHRIRA